MSSIGVPSLLEQLKEDWVANGRDWTRPGFRAVAIHRFGVWLQGRQSWLWRVFLLRALLWRLYRLLYRFVRNHYGIELYYTTSIGRRFVIGHQGGIVIHPKAFIGDDCVIRQNVTIGALSLNRKEGPRLGNRVEVGCGAAILGKICIGDDVRIGPNAVVMSNVAAGLTVFVAPPRLISLHKATEVAPLSR